MNKAHQKEKSNLEQTPGQMKEEKSETQPLTPTDPL